MQEEESPRSALLNEGKEQSIIEKQTSCKISNCMKLVIFIATACILVAIIVPLTIKEEKQGIFITFSVSKFIQLKFQSKFDFMITSYYMMKIKPFKYDHTNA